MPAPNDSISRILGTVGSSWAIRRTVGSSNDCTIIGVVLSDSGRSSPFFFTDSTNSLTMSTPRFV